MSRPAIGIDLGTTFSAIARVNEAGSPEIIANSDGESTTPSAVYIQADGPIIVGQAAAGALLTKAGTGRVFRWMKREMGNPDWGVQVDGRRFSAVDLSAIVLARLRADAAAEIGSFDSAVITVPAYFGEVQRKATMDAARLAGLDVLRVINEPTAAAIAYAAAGRLRGTALVYDFGGGTFDVSVVEVGSPTAINVIASDGDHRLGGFDIDIHIARYGHEQFTAKYGGPDFDDLDEPDRNALIADAEKAKRGFSKLDRVELKVALQNRALSVELDRSTFDRLVEQFVVRTEMLVESAMSQAGLDERRIDTVVLVGGSTRLGAVGELIRRRFGAEGLSSISADKVVAQGAAIQAGMILAERGDSDLPAGVQAQLRAVDLQDVANHSYGTLAVEERGGRRQLRNDILIPKNTPIPTSVTKTYSTVADGQMAVNCEVTQGEDTDPEFVTQLWVEKLDLPPGRPAGQDIQVTFSYDANQRMACDFLDVASGRRKHVTFDMVSPGGDGGLRSVPAAEDIDFSQLDII